MYQSELRDRLMTDRGAPWVSLSTMLRALKQKGITNKKVINLISCKGSSSYGCMRQLTRTAAERDEEQRFEFRMKMLLTYLAEQLVFVDESSFDRRNIMRTRGYAVSGFRAFKRALLVRKKRSVCCLVRPFSYAKISSHID